MRYTDVLQYLYYGALLLLKLQRYERAHEFLELVSEKARRTSPQC